MEATESDPIASLTEVLMEIRGIEQQRLIAAYTQRYQEILFRIPPKILFHRNSVDASLWANQPDVMSAIHAYIDLCAEELRLYKGGFVPDEVWKSWECGIRAGCSLPAVRGLFDDFFKDGPYGDLRAFLDQ